MNQYNIIIIIFICFLIYMIFLKDKTKEEFANDFNHYSWMNDYGQKIREEGLKKIFKFYNMSPEGEVKDHKEQKEAFKVCEGKSDLEKEDNKKSVVEVKEFKLEDPKHSIVDKKDFFAEFLEVKEFNCGSGDLAPINKAFEVKDKKQYAKEQETLYSRGGNVHIRKD